MTRRRFLPLVLALAGCGADKDGATDTMVGDTGATTATGTLTETGTPTGTPTGTSTGTPTGTSTGGTVPPVPDLSDCSVYREQVNTTDGDAYMRGLWFTYDSNGWVILAEQDLDADGFAEDIFSQTFDGYGQLIDQLHDVDGDGIYDERYILSYTSNGDRDVVQWDVDNDGTVDVTYTYLYDATPLLITLETDLDSDGTPDQRTEYIRDGSGNMVQETFDDGIDGTLEAVKDYTQPGLVGGDYYYDWDQTGDGAYNVRVEEAFNSAGQLTLSWQDVDIDGVVETEIHFAYWSTGLLELLSATFFDPTLVIPPLLDGYLDYYQQPTYDADGFTQEILEVVDLDRDGSPGGTFDQTYTETWSWTCPP